MIGGVRLHRRARTYTYGDAVAAALVRRVTRSPWAHVSIYVGPLEAGDDPRCIVEAEMAAGVRAVPLSQFKGQRARIVRPIGLNETDRQRLADWLVGHIGAPYDLAHAWALGRWFLKLPAPRTMVLDAKHFICSSLLVQAFLVVGHPIATSQARSVVPRDFESAAGFEVVTAPLGVTRPTQTENWRNGVTPAVLGLYTKVVDDSLHASLLLRAGRAARYGRAMAELEQPA